MEPLLIERLAPSSILRMQFPKRLVPTDGEVPVASFLTQNFSYKLLWCIPLCTGLPWTEGAGDDGIVDDFNIRLFSDKATFFQPFYDLRLKLLIM